MEKATRGKCGDVRQIVTTSLSAAAMHSPAAGECQRAIDSINQCRAKSGCTCTMESADKATVASIGPLTHSVAQSVPARLDRWTRPALHVPAGVSSGALSPCYCRRQGAALTTATVAARRAVAVTKMLADRRAGLLPGWQCRVA